MSRLQRIYTFLGCLSLMLSPLISSAQVTNFYAAQGGEFLPAGALNGDQENPSVAIRTNGGFIVWQDNITDSDGLGISAVQLNSTLSPIYGVFKVNVTTAGDQEKPRVAMLANGGAIFVWQGGTSSKDHIFARFMTQSGSTFSFGTNTEVLVNTATNYQQAVAVAPLASGNVVVVYESKGQDNSDGFSGVYGQIFTPTGVKTNGEFQINQFTSWNQRSPAVANFPNGNFIVTWVSEQQTSSTTVTGSGPVNGGYNSVDIFARIYTSSGVPVGNEFRVNTTTNICANPTVTVGVDGSYLIAWSQYTENSLYYWDVSGRSYSAAGVAGAPYFINSQRYYNQIAPQAAAVGNDYLVTWTSQNQDGSDEGVYSQFIRNDGVFEGVETRVNTTVVSFQHASAVASDKSSRFLTVWSGFTDITSAADIYSQRFAPTQQPLAAPSTPVALALDTYYFSVAWAPVQGYSVSNYMLYVDGSSTPVLLTTNLWASDSDQETFYAPNSTHTFQLGYSLTDGRASPLSGICTNKTWGPDANHDGLPDNWQSLYYGTNKNNWPSATANLGQGVQAYQVFYWGANPTNSVTWLKQYFTHGSQGWLLNWNTILGGVYQIWSAPNPKGPWAAFGSTRYSYGTNDSVYLGLSNQGYYRIEKLY